MDFIDSIGTKVQKQEDDYIPQEYVFSDGEGVEEGDIVSEHNSSDQEGFDDISSDDNKLVGKKRKQPEEESDD